MMLFVCVCVCVFLASDGPTDERSILFVGSKDAVSITFNFVLICD